MMIRPRHLLPIVLTLALCGLSAHAQQTDGLQQRMSQAEFEASGLNKLSPQELQNLDNWLHAHGKVVTKVVDSSGEPVFYTGDRKRTTIHTRISGHFEGWSTGNQFTMANGQKWKSIEPDPHSCRPTDNPEVRIEPSVFGSWLMYVPSCYESVHVERVQ